jgi:hypothetical protein
MRTLAPSWPRKVAEIPSYLKLEKEAQMAGPASKHTPSSQSRVVGQLCPSSCTRQTTGGSGWHPWYWTQPVGVVATGVMVVEQPFCAIQKSRDAIPPVV